MTTVTVTAIEPHDGKHPGERYETTERTANLLQRRGLVKMGVGPAANKMAPGPQENKGNPLPAAGEAVPQSALPAAQVSTQRTPAPSKTGKRRGRPPGRSSR